MSPEQFLQISDLLTDAIFLVTTDGVIQAANRRAHAALGLKESGLAGLRLQELVDQDAKSLASYLRSCARSREPVMTTLVAGSEDEIEKFRCYGALVAQRTDQSPAVVMLTLFPQVASNEPFLVLNDKLTELAHEVERRRWSEQALQKHLQMSEFGRNFGLALSQAGTIEEMLRRCTDLLVQYLDAAFARIWVTDESGETLVLRASSGMYTHLDGDHGRIPVGQFKIGSIAQLQQPHLTNQVVGDERIHDQSWAQREGMVAFAGYPLIVDGNTIGVMAMFARQHLPDTVIDAMSSVANELAVGISRKQNEDALREKAAALELADARKNEFLAMLAHELRNPMAPIRSGLDLLRSERPESEVISEMQSQMEHIVRIVDDLLDISRIMRGRIEMRKQPLNVKHTLQRSIAAIEPARKAAGHQLHVIDVPEDLWIHGDEVRLTQAVTNLLYNAVKYTPHGGRIEVAAEESGRHVQLSIRDNGIGIEEEFLPELFTLFAQASRALDRSQGGLGIGLTLVKQIVSLHGGEVSAVSEGRGKGSVFTIRLPLTSQPLATHGPLEGGDEPDISCYRIMVVDDNVASAKILARLLEKKWQPEITIAHNGRMAIEQAERRCPDIIFLDIGLPGLSGYEVARALRGKAQFAHTFIVALTGYGTDQDRRKSADAGMNVHLVKPVGLDDLKLVFKMCAQALAEGPS